MHKNCNKIIEKSVEKIDNSAKLKLTIVVGHSQLNLVVSQSDGMIGLV